MAWITVQQRGCRKACVCGATAFSLVVKGPHASHVRRPPLLSLAARRRCAVLVWITATVSTACERAPCNECLTSHAASFDRETAPCCKRQTSFAARKLGRAKDYQASKIIDCATWDHLSWDRLGTNQHRDSDHYT